MNHRTWKVITIATTQAGLLIAVVSVAQHDQALQAISQFVAVLSYFLWIRLLIVEYSP